MSRVALPTSLRLEALYLCSWRYWKSNFTPRATIAWAALAVGVPAGMTYYANSGMPDIVDGDGLWWAWCGEDRLIRWSSMGWGTLISTMLFFLMFANLALLALKPRIRSMRTNRAELLRRHAEEDNGVRILLLCRILYGHRYTSGIAVYRIGDALAVEGEQALKLSATGGLRTAFAVLIGLPFRLALEFFRRPVGMPVSGCLHGAAWRALFACSPEHAVRLSSKALELGPGNLHYETNLAHGLALAGRSDEALALYLGNRGRYLDDRTKQLWDDLIRQDFRDLRRGGINHELFDQVEAEFLK